MARRRVVLSTVVMCVVLLFGGQPAPSAQSGAGPFTTLVTSSTALDLSDRFGVPTAPSTVLGGYVFIGSGSTGVFWRGSGSGTPARIFQRGDAIPGVSESVSDTIVSLATNGAGLMAFSTEYYDTQPPTDRAILTFDMLGDNVVKTLVKSTDVVPGSTNLFDRGLSLAGVADSGDVWFTAPAGQTTVLFVKKQDEAAVRIAGVGDAAPGTGGGTFTSLSVHDANALGEVLLLANISGGSGGSGYFVASRSGVRKVVATGDPKPSTGTFTAPSAGHMNGGGAVVFVAGNGLYRSSQGSITKIVEPGDAFPTVGGTVTAVSSVFGFNDGGDIGFIASPSTASLGPALLRYRQGTVEVAAYRTQAAPGTTGTLTAFSAVSMSGGGVISFVSTLTGGSAARGLFRAFFLSPLTKLALDGEATPLGGVYDFASTGSTRTLNSSLVDAGVYVANSETYWAHFSFGGSATTTLMSVADLLPAGGRVQLRNFFMSARNDQVGFSAQRTGGRPSLFHTDAASGATTRILTEGDVLPGTGGGRLRVAPTSTAVFAGGPGLVPFAATVFGGSAAGLTGVFAWTPAAGLSKMVLSGDLDSTGTAITGSLSIPNGLESVISDSGQLLLSGGGNLYVASIGAAPIPVAKSGVATSNAGVLVGLYSPLTMGPGGQVAFRGNSRLPGEPQNGETRLFLAAPGAPPVKVAGIDEDAPGGGTFAGFASRASLNTGGTLAFAATTTGGPGAGIYTASSTARAAIALHGAATPAGGTYAITAARPDVLINGQQDVVFFSQVAGGSTDSGYFVRRGAQGAVQSLVTQGQSAPGTDGTFVTFRPSLNALSNEFFQLSPSGDVAFSGTLTGTSISGYWHAGANGVIREIAIRGTTPAALGGARIAATHQRSSWLSGGRYLVWLNLIGGSHNDALLTFAPPPVLLAHPSDQVTLAGQNATFRAIATGDPVYRWQISTDDGATWTNLTDGGIYSQTGTGSLVITGAPASLNRTRFRATATAGGVTATTNAGALTVRGNATLTPAALKFAATKSGETLTATGRQTVAITFAGAASAWTAASNASWLLVTGGSGSGAGTFTAEIVNPGNVIGNSTSLSAVITVATPNAPATSTTIPVTLTVTHGAGTTAPFGQVDTPTPNAAGVVGAIGVTGWAMDDLAVASVKIYRNCLPFENQASCQTVGGQSVVFVGDAAFLSGARPDVESAFPNHPQAYRAGWGYLMMTSMLPHVTAQQPYGGQGPLTLYAFATDVEGNVTLLGRNQTDHTPTSITMANDTIAKPFGAIDTPGQGETVSGIVHNFGWALTPDSDTAAGNSDILIPTNGTTMFVFIDGAPVAPIAYNQCRGNVGNPVPSGVFCNDDVANIFGRTTPQPALTVRTSNPTRHRNLDAGNAAIGVYSIDTTKLSNGLHTIAWSVTDSAGRTEGIGSRFFNVLNSSSDTMAAAQEIQQRTPVIHGRIAPASGPADAGTDPGLAYRTGFDIAAPFVPLTPAEGGSYRIAIPELGRLEVRVPGGEAAYLEVNGELRALPAGASLKNGRFAWAPPAGYVGEYRFILLGGGGLQKLGIRVGEHVE